mgnify:CR=1 FL=1
MTIDKILEIGIDEKERIFIKPDKERFTLIYRTATEVHWDKDGLFFIHQNQENGHILIGLDTLQVLQKPNVIANLCWLTKLYGQTFQTN